jgi:DNA-binding NtrC family response regulator
VNPVVPVAPVVASDRAMERDHKLSLLLDLGALLAQEVELDGLLARIGHRVAQALRAERATVYLVDGATGELRSRVADLPELDEIRLPPGRGVAGWVAESGELVNLHDAARDPRHFAEVDRATGFVTRTMLCAPIVDTRRATRGVLQVLNKLDGRFTGEDEAFVRALAGQVSQALERTSLRPREGSTRGVELRGVFNHIVGASPSMRAVSEQVLRVAPTDATVLLRGETGTGKGVFARALHANSRRREGPFVTVDCTTLPAALVESELFGHERGAFTGADRRVPGKVERAQGGTLFLDEVGELPLAMQSKLLRLLQERAYERVGGQETLRADLRVVAATHRDLAAMCTRGEFREDLLFRLRVVEIALPPLRARDGDEVHALAQHFLDTLARRYERVGLRFSAGALAALRAHPWPGNVRELEHAVERAVVLAPVPLLEAEHLGLPAWPARADGAAAVQAEAQSVGAGGVTLPLGLPLTEVARRYTEATLAAEGGNRSRAAVTLGVGRNTLRRKLRAD